MNTPPSFRRGITPLIFTGRSSGRAFFSRSTGLNAAADGWCNRSSALSLLNVNRRSQRSFRGKISLCNYVRACHGAVTNVDAGAGSLEAPLPCLQLTIEEQDTFVRSCLYVPCVVILQILAGGGDEPSVLITPLCRRSIAIERCGVDWPQRQVLKLKW